MPYIKQKERYEIDKQIKDVICDIHDYSEGDLNYLITRILHEWLYIKGLKYVNINTLMGVLGSVKQEFYRTVVAPYEDIKRRENGSVSELDKGESNE